LVPKGQGTQVNYVPQEKCERIGPLTYCTITYKEESIDISEKIGIKVLEVSSIYDALKYFLT
jgi:predicted S18 family serine protease